MKKVWEFKVEYQRDSEVCKRFHYFNAENYEQARSFHETASKASLQNLTDVLVMRKCPYSEKWFTEEEDPLINFDK